MGIVTRLCGSLVFGRALNLVAAPDAPKVIVRGCRYVERQPGALRFGRFWDDVLSLPSKELGLNPAKARNCTGMVLSFKTDSRKV